jgi:hypothetical protein
MRLNKFLLMAAALSMALAATVFTISCSGDDGATGATGPAGPKGAAGANCTLRSETTSSGVDIWCDDEKIGSLLNGNGVGSNDCVLRKDGAQWFAYCNGVQSGQVSGGGSGTLGSCGVTNEDIYNEHEIRLNCQGTTFYLCDGVPFIKDIENAGSKVCTNDYGRTQDVNMNLYNNGVASGGSAATPAGGRLLAGSGFECNSTKYNPNEEVCFAGTPQKKDLLCGGKDYASTQFCQTLRNGKKATMYKCGINNATYPNTQFCWAEGTNSLATNALPYPGYTGAALTGSNGDVWDYCGQDALGADIVYNPHVTSATSALAATQTHGTSYRFAPKGTFCQNNMVMTRCYDGISAPVAGTASDTNAAVSTSKNIPIFYNAKTQFCRKLAVADAQATSRVEAVDLCFNIPTGTVAPTGDFFDGVDYFCNTAKGEVGRRCAGENDFYNEEREFCYKEGALAIAVGEKCNTTPTNSTPTYLSAQYDPRKQFCTTVISSIATGSTGTAIGPSGTTDGTGTTVFPVQYNSASTYTYTERPVDLCKGNIKYNYGGWLWQSCLVDAAALQDRTKDLYQHCGIGEKPKEDFTACVALPTCSGTDVWDDHKSGGAGCSASCTGGATAPANGTCSCPAGYEWESTAVAGCKLGGSSTGCGMSSGALQVLGLDETCIASTVCNAMDYAEVVEGICTCTDDTTPKADFSDCEGT